VRAGDTLGEIAHAHGLTVATLSELNNIEDPRTLRVGQVLMIPAGGSDVPAPDRHPLPSALRQQLDAMRVVNGKWRYVVIHHSATRRGTMQGMDMYHRQKRRMENGLAYHFVIGYPRWKNRDRRPLAQTTQRRPPRQ
jgi:LysM repeat protein